MEEDEGGSEGGRLGSTRRRSGASEPMESWSGRKNSSKRPAREKSGRPSRRPKDCDERSYENRQTGDGLEMVLTIFCKKKEEEEEAVGSVLDLLSSSSID